MKKKNKDREKASIPAQQKNSKAYGRRYALCVGIGLYTELTNHDLRYAVSDAEAIASKLSNPRWGDFEVKLLTEPVQTTKQAVNEGLYKILNEDNLHPEDIVVIYLSCHGGVYGRGNTFYLVLSDTALDKNGMPDRITIIDIHDLTKILTEAKVKNIIFLIDACYSGGAGATLQHLNFDLDLGPDTNLFIIGAARHDQTAYEISSVKHGIFTSCLLQAFEQKPSKSDGWLTISDIHSFITEEIKTFRKEKPIQIQSVSANVNPNLPFIRNPLYSADSLKFYEAVKNLLWLVQYEPVEIDISTGAPAGFYISELQAGYHILRVGVIPYFNQVEILDPEIAKKIASFVREQVKNGNIDEGLLVTALEVSSDVKSAIFKIEPRYLELKTYESAWKSLIDFKKHLHKLVDDYESASDGPDEPSLAQVYIPLTAEQREYELEVSSNNQVVMNQGVSLKAYKVIWQGDLETQVKEWLFTTTSRLAILADYGGGKSTFCKHIAATLTKEYFSAKNQGHYEQRIPLVIPLGDFTKGAVDLEGYLVAYLKRTCKVNNPDFEALMKMAEAGMLLFILDGFDEMASRATTDTVYQNIALFEKLANLPKNKLILTTRPEYFMSLSQEQKALRSYPCLHLQPFNERQVKRYLQKRVPLLKPQQGVESKDWTYYHHQIKKIHDLSDLSRRPVLLEMIIKTLPLLIAEDEVVNRPNLYQRYLEGELDRQVVQQRRNLLINRQKRFEIMEQVALELFRTGSLALTSNQILKISRDLLNTEQQDEMDGALREILTCSFFIRIDNEFRFSHQSFWEYLVASKLAKDITSNQLDNLRLKPISLMIQSFLVEFEEKAFRKSSGSSSISNNNINFNIRKLEALFKANPKDKWLSTNLVSLLASLLEHDQFNELPLQGADLSDLDLRDIDLHKVIFSGAILSDANFSGAILSDANLDRASLDNAVLSDASLDNAVLSGANLNRAVLDGANLSKADLSNAILKKATLKKAILKKADLNRAVLDGANLNEADLSDANVNYADLSYANLIHTYLNCANLSKAILRRANLNNADLNEADLSEADLNGADLRETNLREAVLCGADLSNVDLREAVLREADLSDADLSDADLSEADLSDADLIDVTLTGADLRSANLDGTDLRGADLRGAIISRESLDNAILSSYDL